MLGVFVSIDSIRRRPTTSTFSSDIAYVVSRAEVEASDPSRQVLCAGPAGPALRALSRGPLASWEMP